MPYTTFADGSVLTASQVNTNFRDQVITTCTSGTRPSGTQGQHIYETDTDRLYIYSGSGWIEGGGIGAWTSYTPTLTQSAAVTKTVTYSKYFKIGRMVTVNVSLAVTGTGTGNNVYTISLPFTASTAGVYVGSGTLYDISANFNYPGIAYIATTTTAAQLDSSQPTAGILMGQTGSSYNAAIAAGDSVLFHMVYESTT